VSPDEQAVAGVIASATRRARALLVAELVAWAAVAAAAALAVTAATGAARPTRVIVIAVCGFATAVTVGAVRRRSIRRPAIVAAIERALPFSRNLVFTAGELLAGDLHTTPLVRARVLANAAGLARRASLARALPLRRLSHVVFVAAMAWAVALAIALWRPGAVTVVQRLVPASPTSPSPHVVATIQPPAYTGLAARTLQDPLEIDAVEGSAATVVMGRFTTRAVLERTGYLAIGEGDSRRTIPVVVSPDALPSVRLTAPGRDLVYAGGNARITFDAHATDDFGLRSLALKYTKVSGSGENFAFQDGEIPLGLAKASGRDWTGRASRSLAELELKDGDVFVYRAEAADARPGGGVASSDAFFIEISKLGAAAGDAFTMPEEETRYALSQQMLIVKTERLNQRRGSMAPSAATEEALNLAVEQRMIRAEFVFMLGGEIENEEVEAEQSNELQEGRLRNQGQRDLRAATVAMSQAEKLLSGGNTADALAAERAAVAALQRAFARGRYILRALATRSQLDAARRLTGSLADARDWWRLPAPATSNRRAALLQDLLRGIAELSRVIAERGRVQKDPAYTPSNCRPGPFGPGGQVGPGTTPTSSRPGPFGPGEQVGPGTTPTSSRPGPFGPCEQARVLAEEAMRIDPASADLRHVATELQRAGDAGADATAFARAVASAASAAVVEARRAGADSPVDAREPAPHLGGAFADALTNARLKASRSTGNRQ
jgi:hypothetical protein